MLQSSDIRFHTAERVTGVHVNDYQIDEENHKALNCKSPSKATQLAHAYNKAIWLFFQRRMSMAELSVVCMQLMEE